MPIYNEGGPAAYAQSQQSRQDDQFRQLLQMMMIGMQQKTQQGQYFDQMRQQQIENLREDEKLRLSRKRAEDYGRFIDLQTKPPKTTQWESQKAGGEALFKSGYLNKEEFDILTATGQMPTDYEDFKKKEEIKAGVAAKYRQEPSEKVNPFVREALSSLDNVVNQRVRVKTAHPSSTLSYDSENDNFLKAAGFIRQSLMAKLMSPSISVEERAKIAQLVNGSTLEKIGKAMMDEKNFVTENGVEYLIVPDSSLKFAISR